MGRYVDYCGTENQRLTNFGTMQPQLYEQVFSVQNTHWWGRSRRRLAFDLLQRFGLQSHCRHVDVGCGTGQNLKLLDSLDPLLVVGIDVSPIALALARKACRNCELVQSNINYPLPFDDETFDVATIFNVLYHEWVNNELAVLRETRRLLRTNGLLLVTEPAFLSLARKNDIVDMAKRRYRLRPFAELLRQAGFTIAFSNYFTSFGAPIILGAKAVGALGGNERAGNAEVPELRAPHLMLNQALYGLARIEAALVTASVPLPFGTTLICVARRL